MHGTRGRQIGATGALRTKPLSSPVRVVPAAVPAKRTTATAAIRPPHTQGRATTPEFYTGEERGRPCGRPLLVRPYASYLRERCARCACSSSRAFAGPP